MMTVFERELSGILDIPPRRDLRYWQRRKDVAAAGPFQRTSGNGTALHLYPYLSLSRRATAGKPGAGGAAESLCAQPGDLCRHDGRDDGEADGAALRARGPLRLCAGGGRRRRRAAAEGPCALGTSHSAGDRAGDPGGGDERPWTAHRGDGPPGQNTSAVSAGWKRRRERWGRNRWRKCCAGKTLRT